MRPWIIINFQTSNISNIILFINILSVDNFYVFTMSDVELLAEFSIHLYLMKYY